MHILVVEDQDSIRSMIEALVSARGHKVVAVSSGAKALEVAIASPPDVVLLDLHLPGQFDGFAVCSKLRASPPTKDVPVVIISARDDAPSRARATEVGATRITASPSAPWPCSKRSSARGAQLPVAEHVEKLFRAPFGGGHQAGDLFGGDTQLLAELIEHLSFLRRLLSVDERQENRVLQEHATVVGRKLGERNVSERTRRLGVLADLGALFLVGFEALQERLEDFGLFVGDPTIRPRHADQ